MDDIDPLEWNSGFPFRCAWCDMPFYSMHTLEQHEIAHENEDRAARGLPPIEEDDYDS